MNPSQESAPSPEPAQHSGPPADPSGGGSAFGGAEGSSGGPAFGGAQASSGGSAFGGAEASGGGPSYGGAEAGAIGPEVYGLAAGSDGYGLAHPTGPEPVEAGFGARWWGMAATSHRPWKRTAVVAVLCAVVVLALGAPLGLLWAWLAPSVPVVDIGDSIVVNDPSPEQYIAADGWYTLLGLGFGLLVAAVAWLLLRRDRGPFLLLGVVAGTLGAGYYIAPWIGEMIGRSAYEHWREIATRGATYLAPPEVHSTGPRLVSAFAAAIVLTLLAGWSNDPDLDQPGAKPGYGPNMAAVEPYDGSPGPDGLAAPDGSAGPGSSAAPGGSARPGGSAGQGGSAAPGGSAGQDGSAGPGGSAGHGGSAGTDEGSPAQPSAAHSPEAGEALDPQPAHPQGPAEPPRA